MKRIIVSMTSYPGRIANVGKSIFLLKTKQTMPPDEIHLWLSVEEFPKKENSIPEDLRVITSTMDGVYLHWLPKNTYVHKRHEIFKYVSDAYVFLIDDDVKYSDDLIENVINAAKKFPDTIICYNRYPDHVYRGKRIIYSSFSTENVPRINKSRWCGQSMIPASIYPKSILSDENQKKRDESSPISDECWFQPWTVFFNIPIFHLHYNWGIDIDKKNGKDKGIVSFSHKKDTNGLEKRDNWLYAVLCKYPEIMKKYATLFKYGK